MNVPSTRAPLLVGEFPGETITSSVQVSVAPRPVPWLVTVQPTVTLAGSAMVTAGAVTLLTARSAKGASVTATATEAVLSVGVAAVSVTVLPTLTATTIW